jgi:hypothetical protein
MPVAVTTPEPFEARASCTRARSCARHKRGHAEGWVRTRPITRTANQLRW